ncbi:S2545-like protein, partial [Mya arenaria]
TLESDREKRTSSYFNIYISGCVGGAAQLVFVVPVDYIKTALQSQIPHEVTGAASGNHVLYPRADPKYNTDDIRIKGANRQYFKGPLQCAKAIFKERGIMGFYKGGVAMGLREIPSYGIYCLSFEVLNAEMKTRGLTDERGVIASLVSGGIAGSLTWASIIPFDVIKSRYQADFAGEYQGFLHCARCLYKEGGVRIFYTGCLVTCLRAFPVNAVTFT